MRILFDAIVARFMDYISYDTQSSEENEEKCPSTQGQMIFAEHLVEEMRSMGFQDVTLDENGYVMATIPATCKKKLPVIGFIAHLDTSPDMTGKNVKPRIVEQYDGGDILLNAEENVLLSPKDFPELLDYEGEPILVTDGTTLLGADDKAGVAAILEAAVYLLQHPEIPHGRVRVAFTPDEEVGRGADRFDVEKFAADFAYTVDGGERGTLEYENFNAANVVVKIEGRNIHPGYAKGKMKNALTIAKEWQMMLPEGECPECTEDYEGFYHVHKIVGDVENTTMMMLVRDHDHEKFEARKRYLEQMAELLNARYGEGTVRLESHDIYYNMYEKIAPCMEIVELAERAMEAVGIEPYLQPIRGGTDGARLSFLGLPCPNLFTGGANFHGKLEYLPLLSLQQAGETVLEIICQAAERELSQECME